MICARSNGPYCTFREIAVPRSDDFGSFRRDPGKSSETLTNPLGHSVTVVLQQKLGNIEHL